MRGSGITTSSFTLKALVCFEIAAVRARSSQNFLRVSGETAMKPSAPRALAILTTSEAAAITAAGLHGIDLALVDINLIGDGDGLALARALKETWGVPVMFLSGDVAAAARHARLATALVLKPYGRRDVLAAIARAVDSGAVAA